LPDPVPQRLARTTDLGRDRADRPISRAVLALVIEHHPDRASRTSGEKGVLRFVMAPSSQELEPPGNPERFTAQQRLDLCAHLLDWVEIRAVGRT